MVIHRDDPSATHFIEVDLDIFSKTDLQPLVTALGKKVLVLYAGRNGRTYRAHFELTKITKTADATIRGLCTLIEALPKPERALWNAAKDRDFNIGVQAGIRPHSTAFALTQETLKAACELCARIVFTVYAPETARGSTHAKPAATARKIKSPSDLRTANRRQSITPRR